MKDRTYKKRFKRFVGLAIRKGLLGEKLLKHCGWSEHFRSEKLDFIYYQYDSYVGDCSESSVLDIIHSELFDLNHDFDWIDSDEDYFSDAYHKFNPTMLQMIHMMEKLPTVRHGKISHYLKLNYND